MRGAAEPLEAGSRRKQGARGRGAAIKGRGEEGGAAEGATVMSAKTRGSFKAL